MQAVGLKFNQIQLPATFTQFLYIQLNHYFKKHRRDFSRWSVSVLVITFLIGIPAIFIFAKLFDGPGESWKHIARYLLAKYVQNSLYLAFSCAVFTMFFGIVSAWFSVRYEFPGRKMLEWLLILPLAVPSYITAYAYAGIFDYGGSLNLLLSQFSLHIGRIDLMNIYGLSLVLSISLYPYVYVACRAFFLHHSQSLIEASQMLGKREVQHFFKLIFPMARPAVVGGVILVLMEVLNDYGAAKYYGVNTFTTGIFKSWFGYKEPDTAIYLSALLLIIIFSLIIIEQKQRKKRQFAIDSANDRKLERLHSSKVRRFLISFIVALPVILGFVIPVAQLTYWAAITYSGINWSELLRVVLQSLGIATFAAISCVLVSVALLVVKDWNRLSWVNHLSKIGILGYAIPGAVIAVGVYIPGLYLDKWLIRFVQQTFSIKISLLLTGTVIALIYAYVVRFLAVAFNPIAAGKEKIQPGLIEASQSLGKGALYTFSKIELPLLRPALLGAFILVFIDVMKELPLTLILKPYYVQTLAIEAYQYASDERIMEAAMPSLIIIATGVFPVIFLNRLIEKR
ncbi:MAG: iron ABC transporter permease [Bacteroidota bacterium]